MESKREEKLNVLNSMLAKCIEEKRMVEIETNIVAQCLSDSLEARNLLLLSQNEYKEHLKVVYNANRDSPGARIITKQRIVNDFQEELEEFIQNLSNISEQLSVQKNERISFINGLEEKRKQIEEAKTVKKLNEILFDTPVPLEYIPFLSGNGRRDIGAEALAIAARLKRCLVSLVGRLRRLVAEEQKKFREI